MAENQNPNNEPANTDGSQDNFDWLNDVENTGGWPDVEEWLANVGAAGDEPRRQNPGASRNPGHNVSRQPADAGVHFEEEGDRNVAHLNPPQGDERFRDTVFRPAPQAAGGTPPTEPHQQVVVNRGPKIPWGCLLTVGIVFALGFGVMWVLNSSGFLGKLSNAFNNPTATPVAAAQQQEVAPQVQPTVLSQADLDATVRAAVEKTVTASAQTPQGITLAEQTAGFNQPAPTFTPAAPQVQPQAAMPAVNTCTMMPGIEKVDLYESTTSSNPWGSIFDGSVVDGTVIKVVAQSGGWVSLEVTHLANWGSNAQGQPVITGYGTATGWAMPSQGLICNLGNRQQQSGANPTPSF